MGGPVAAAVEALIPCVLARPARRLRERLPYLDRVEVFDVVFRKIKPIGQRLADLFDGGRGTTGPKRGIQHRFSLGRVVWGHEAGDAGVKDRCIWLLVQVGQVQDRRRVLRDRAGRGWTINRRIVAG